MLLYFNPLPPHGGRPVGFVLLLINFTFQSTPSAWRETTIAAIYLPGEGVFQSTPSAWRETVEPNLLLGYDCISIHSLRMEGDDRPAVAFFLIRYFNPLPPHGGRQAADKLERTSGLFQSTPSAWRETLLGEPIMYQRNISIHSLRMEGDPEIDAEFDHWELFQSTPSAWRETWQ